MNKIALIIRREYASRVKKKSFIIMTILGPILITGLIGLAIWMGLSDSTKHKILVVDETGTEEVMGLFTNELENTSRISFEYTNKDITNEGFEESSYTLLLRLNEKVLTNKAYSLFFKKTPSINVQGYVKSQLEKIIERKNIDDAGMTPDDYYKIKPHITLDLYDIQDTSQKSHNQEIAAIGFGFAILIYMFIFLYGVQVMRGVIEEKTNRIVEVIISSVKPFQLMMGKIVGIALVGLTQFALWIILTMALTAVIQPLLLPDNLDPVALIETNAQLAPDVLAEIQAEKGQEELNYFSELILHRVNWGLLIGMFLFYFLGGYLLYASLFAAVGAAVDSEADTQQFMLPITIPLVFGFLVAQFALQNPEGPSAFWFSIIPFTSPVVMMVRVAMGFDSDTVWQLFLSMGLLIAGFLFTTWLAGKIYRTGILMYGKKVTYKELWKWLFYKG